MKIPPHFLRITTLAMASPLLVLLVADTRQVRAITRSERYVLQQLRNGERARLETLPEDERRLSATFIAKLLTTNDPSLRIRELTIFDAIITGHLNLEGHEVSYDVSLMGCTFLGEVNFKDMKFAKGLNLSGSTFDLSVNLDGSTIGLDLNLDRCRFRSVIATFQRVGVGRNFTLYEASFDTDMASFDGSRVGGRFALDRGTVHTKFYVSFESMRVDGAFSAIECTFTSTVLSFYGSRFADVLLARANFDGCHNINFNKMEADLVSFDGVKSMPPQLFGLDRMRFKMLTPINATQMRSLFAEYNAGFYSDIETSFRMNGYPDEADKIFIAKKRAERGENCKDFLRQCNRGAWAFSLFEDMLAGYGKRLEYLLYWSLGFLVIGTLVFRSEKGMRTKDAKDAESYEGKYRAFWYSLDLFLPVIKLGEADVWTPKDYRRWANLYRKVHIIIGSLFVPIGLAAWTGIIK